MHEKFVSDAESGKSIMELCEIYNLTFYQVFEKLKWSDIDHEKRVKGTRKFVLRDDLPKHKALGGNALNRKD